MVVGDQFGLGGTWEIGHEKNLVYPVNLPEQNYVIYFHVKDKTTNVVTTRSTGLSLNTVFSKGGCYWERMKTERYSLICCPLWETIPY